MTSDVSRRSLLALGAGLGAGLGATALLGGSALAKAPKLGTQSAYFYRFNMGSAEVTVVSDGPLPLGPPKGTFIGVPDEEVRKMLSDNFLSPDNVVLETVPISSPPAVKVPGVGMLPTAKNPSASPRPPPDGVGGSDRSTALGTVKLPLLDCSTQMK